MVVIYRIDLLHHSNMSVSAAISSDAVEAITTFEAIRASSEHCCSPLITEELVAQLVLR